jgi:hypothetical protein
MRVARRPRPPRVLLYEDLTRQATHHPLPQDLNIFFPPWNRAMEFLSLGLQSNASRVRRVGVVAIQVPKAREQSLEARMLIPTINPPPVVLCNPFDASHEATTAHIAHPNRNQPPKAEGRTDPWRQRWPHRALPPAARSRDYRVGVVRSSRAGGRLPRRRCLRSLPRRGQHRRALGPQFADAELSPPPASKKDLFMRLSDGPILLADGLTVWTPPCPSTCI